MTTEQLVRTQPQTGPMHALREAMRGQVDSQLLPGISYALLERGKVVEKYVYGYADIEAGIKLREDHIYRVLSNTKLVTACAVLLLFQEGHFALDDPIESFIPELASRKVLKAGARSIRDVEPARASITIRHLLTHTSGLSYGIFDRRAVLFDVYNSAGILNSDKSLADMIDALAPLPLAFHPGSQWEYSIAADVLARLIEIVASMTFGQFLEQRIFSPLGMADTGFWVPEPKHNRMCTVYMGTNVLDPRVPGLRRRDGKPDTDAFKKKRARESGSSGLVSTLGDTVKLLQTFFPGGGDLLNPDTVDEMCRNQLPAGMYVKVPHLQNLSGRCFGLGAAFIERASQLESLEAIGELGWGGLAGTVWMINPRKAIAAALMTQRYMAFDNPYSFEFKRLAYQALCCRDD